MTQARERAEAVLEKVKDTDEPVFVLRAKDIFSLFLLNQYWDMVSQIGPGNPNFEELIANTMSEFRNWQIAHPEKLKYPD